MQEQDIVGINHGGVRGVAVRLPNRPAVKLLQRSRTRTHVVKTSEPDESIPAINVPELADDLHPERFLRLDEFPVEESINTCCIPG